MTSTNPGQATFPLNKPGWHWEVGNGRCEVRLLAFSMGQELVVCLYNGNAHLGAIAVGEYDPVSGRASTSVITRTGHKDDAVAVETAHTIAKATRNAVCVMAGIHIDNVTPQEIQQVVENCREAVGELVEKITPKG